MGNQELWDLTQKPQKQEALERKFAGWGFQ